MARKVGKYKISERDAKLFDQDASTINTTGTNLTLSGFLKTEGSGTQLGNGAGDTLGFYGAAPVNRPDAINQTAYTTADRTIDNVTAAALTDNSGGTASQTIAAIGGTYDQDEVRNAVASLADEVNKLIVDLANVKQVLNATIDSLQETGLVG